MVPDRLTMLPLGCIEAENLYTLARALKRLQAWHIDHGGQSKEKPCLRLIERSEKDNETRAIIFSANQHWKLVLRKGEWIFISEALTS